MIYSLFYLLLPVPQVRSQPSDSGGGRFPQILNLLGFENMEFPVALGETSIFKIIITLLCGQSSNLHRKSLSLSPSRPGPGRHKSTSFY